MNPPTLPRPLGPGRRLPFAALVVIGVGQAVGGLVLAVSVQWAFDSLVTTPDEIARSQTDPTVSGQLVLAALLAAVLLTALCRGAERVTAEWLGQKYVTAVRDTLFQHLTTVPARTVQSRRSGSMLMRFVGDLSALRSWVSLGLARLTVAGVAVGGVLVGLAVMNPAIAVAVACVLLVGTIATVLAGRALVTTSGRARRRRARLTGEVAERLGNLSTVQANGQSQRERRRVDRHSAKVARAMISKAGAAGTVRAIAEATAGCATVAVLLVGAAAVQRGDTSAGTVVGTLAVVGFLTGSLRDLGRVAEYAAGAKVGTAAARRFLALRPLADDPSLPDIGPGPGRVELDQVGFGRAVRGVSAVVEPGQTVAIVGPNGAGKSTLMSLAARLVDPDRGSVRLDGFEFTDVALSSLRKQIGVVSPDLPLMRGSLRRNVCYRDSKAPQDHIDWLVDQCGLRQVIEDLPDGWDSDVGEAGKRLSSGQRARVALARAMMAHPRVLVLDELDAHLDPHTQALVRRVVLGRPGTTLLISHRKELVQLADVVWHLSDGELIESGPPGRLLAAGGPTSQLFASGSAMVTV